MQKIHYAHVNEFQYMDMLSIKMTGLGNFNKNEGRNYT